VVDLINSIILILNFISTWRLMLALLVAAATAFAASLVMPSGRALAITIYAIVFLGATLGSLWQYRHEGRIKRRRPSGRS